MGRIEWTSMHFSHELRLRCLAVARMQVAEYAASAGHAAGFLGADGAGEVSFREKSPLK